MPAFNLASVNHYPVRRAASNMPRIGSWVAHNNLIRALHDFGVVNRWSFLPSGGPGPISGDEQRAFDEFSRNDYPRQLTRPNLKPWESLFVDRVPDAFVSAIPWSQRLAELADLPGGARPGIVTVLHSVPWPDMRSSYFNLAQTSVSRDVIVPTSTDAERAFRAVVSWPPRSARSPVHATIKRIPLGVTVPSLVPDGRDTRYRLGFNEADCVVLYFGRLSPVYKADLVPLLIMLKRLLDAGLSVALVISGSDEGYGSDLKSLASELGIGYAFRVLPNPSDDERSNLYGLSDIFVSPSDNIQESFGLTLLEAMAHAKPVVASDWSGYRDIVVDGSTGFLIPTHTYAYAFEAAALLMPIDPSTQRTTGRIAQSTTVDIPALTKKVELLVRSKPLRVQMGETGRRRIELDYSWKTVASQYAELFAAQKERALDHGRAQSWPLSRAFAHYPTRVLRHSDVVSAAVGQSPGLLEPLFRAHSRLAAAILESAEKPIRLGRLISSSGQTEIVLRLIKYGLLQTTQVQKGP